jgi:hypothetical protein
VLTPIVGGLYVTGGGALNGGVGKLPLGPLLAVPLALVGLGAGLPLLFGALMRPLGAMLSSAMGAVALIGYELTLGDGNVPFLGGPFRRIPDSVGVVELVERVERLVTIVPQTLFLVVLWTAMAGVVSVGEWTRRWPAGLAVATVGGLIGYATFVSDTQSLRTEAMISLGLAAIIYAVSRYLGSRARG